MTVDYVCPRQHLTVKTIAKGAGRPRAYIICRVRVCSSDEVTAHPFCACGRRAKLRSKD